MEDEQELPAFDWQELKTLAKYLNVDEDEIEHEGGYEYSYKDTTYLVMDKTITEYEWEAWVSAMAHEEVYDNIDEEYYKYVDGYALQGDLMGMYTRAECWSIDNKEIFFDGYYIYKACEKK